MDQAAAAPKPLLVGEMNPYGSDPSFALYHTPENCASGSCATCNHSGPDGVPCGHECHQEGAGA